MRPVTNVSFDRQERQAFERADLWTGLAEGREGNVLRRVAQKDPGGMSWKTLTLTRELLIEIIHKAQNDLDQYRPLLAKAPTTAPEGSLIANPKLALETIVQAREQALRDAAEALDLITEALAIATAPADDLAEMPG